MDIGYHFDRTFARFVAAVLRRRGTYGRYFGRWRNFFDIYEEAGIHVLPAHFYSPVPDTRYLTDSVLKRRSAMPGIRIDVGRALDLLRRVAAFRTEYAQFTEERSDPHTFSYANPAYFAGEAEILYGLVRALKPRRIIEIGSGHTTLITAQAARTNAHELADDVCEYTSIDPYAPDFVEGLPGLSRLVRKPVQDVDMVEFESLRANDILFIDSTHVLRSGSDVVYEYLEILPRLSAGVIVHIHDIFMPAEYPVEWIREARFFWNEQYLLQAMLANSRAWDVLWPGHLMHLEHSSQLSEAMPAYHPHTCRPSCWWMVRTESRIEV